MPKHRSIGDRLSRCKPEQRVEIAKEWAHDWIGATNPQFKRVEDTLHEGDARQALKLLHELYQDTIKRMYALDGIFDKIQQSKNRAITYDP